MMKPPCRRNLAFLDFRCRLSLSHHSVHWIGYLTWCIQLPQCSSSSTIVPQWYLPSVAEEADTDRIW